jgi:ABC-type lipoprotein release transport system permease subunit
MSYALAGILGVVVGVVVGILATIAVGMRRRRSDHIPVVIGWDDDGNGVVTDARQVVVSDLECLRYLREPERLRHPSERDD